ncbi:MAG: hypothetical protein KatS3mg124_0719 [Porticoccaceae bacterium]|nr:MAG: hypothetical protein KatS3mg124_0719 [Porticoccaceae bacterium]
MGALRMGRKSWVAGVALLASALALAGRSLHAQELGEGGSGGRGLEYGLHSELRYEDNIYYAERGEVDSWIAEARPWVRATLYHRGNTYQALYRLRREEFLDSGDDSHTDHELQANLNHRFTPRHAVGVEAGYALLTERRGTGFSEEPNALVDGPDDYRRAHADLVWFLGVPSAPLRFELSARHRTLQFDSSYVGHTRDYRWNQLGALARYRIGARTDLLLEYRRAEVDYFDRPRDFSGRLLNLDAREDDYLAGVAWEMTAKTRGSVRIGESRRNYRGEPYSDGTAHWEVELEWRPRSYSRLALKTARASQETHGSGLFIDSRRHELAWTHAWSGRLNSELAGGYLEDDFAASRRVDDRYFFRAQLGYEYAEWLRFRLGYQYWENDSTLPVVDYRQNAFFLAAQLAL